MKGKAHLKKGKEVCNGLAEGGVRKQKLGNSRVQCRGPAADQSTALFSKQDSRSGSHPDPKTGGGRGPWICILRYLNG